MTPNIVEIDKNEVRDVLKELAELKRKEADCLDKLAKVIPEMRDSEVVILSERVEVRDAAMCVRYVPENQQCQRF